jgi:hypothetical protein
LSLLPCFPSLRTGAATQDHPETGVFQERAGEQRARLAIAAKLGSAFTRGRCGPRCWLLARRPS